MMYDIASSLQVLTFSTAIHSWTTHTSTATDVSRPSSSSVGCTEVWDVLLPPNHQEALSRCSCPYLDEQSHENFVTVGNRRITSYRSTFTRDDRPITCSLAKSDVVAFKVRTSCPCIQFNVFSTRHPCLLLDLWHLVPQIATPDDAFFYKRLVSFHASILCCKDTFLNSNDLLSMRPLQCELLLPSSVRNKVA